MGWPIWQMLKIIRGVFGWWWIVWVDNRRLQSITFDRHAVDIKSAMAHLNRVAWQADQALDIIGRIVMRPFENNNVAALRRMTENTAGKRRQAKKSSGAAIAIFIFRNEQ